MRKIQQRIFSIVLAFLCVAAFAACNGNDGETTRDTGAGEDISSPTVAGEKGSPRSGAAPSDGQTSPPTVEPQTTAGESPMQGEAASPTSSPQSAAPYMSEEEARQWEAEIQEDPYYPGQFEINDQTARDYEDAKIWDDQISGGFDYDD